MGAAAIRNYIRQNHLALVALAVALVGVPTAWAIGKNTVGTKQLKPGAVQNSDLADDSVTSPKIADGEVSGDDVAEGTFGQVPSAATADSAQTAATAQTAQTAQSAQTAATAQSAQTATDAGTLDGIDSAGFLATGGKAADSEKVDGVDGANLIPRSTFHSATGSQQPAFFSYFANTALASSFEFRAIEIRTTGNPREFKVCNNGPSGTVPLVRYLDGVRTTIAAEPSGSCNTTFTVDAGEDFSVVGAAKIIWGIPSTTLGAPGNNFYLFGFDADN